MSTSSGAEIDEGEWQVLSDECTKQDKTAFPHSEEHKEARQRSSEVEEATSTPKPNQHPKEEGGGYHESLETVDRVEEHAASTGKPTITPDSVAASEEHKAATSPDLQQESAAETLPEDASNTLRPFMPRATCGLRCCAFLNHGTQPNCAFQPNEALQKLAKTDAATPLLFEAIRYGATTHVINLLQAGVGLRQDHSVAVYANGAWRRHRLQPMAFAAAQGDREMVSLLLQHGGANASTPSEFDYTPLSAAAEGGHVAVCQLLLEHGQPVDDSPKQWNTPLVLAAGAGHAAVCSLLLSHGADPNRASRNRGNTPLFLAAYGGHKEVCRLLLEAGVDANRGRSSDGITPLLVAVERDHYDVCALLLDHGASVNKRSAIAGSLPLLKAACHGRTRICQLLLQHGADVNAANLNPGWFPLLFAASSKCVDTCRVLLEAGADPNQSTVPMPPESTVPHSNAAAVESKSVEPQKLTKGAEGKHGGRPSGYTALMEAARIGDERVCEVLLAAGADPNQARGTHGATPLIFAAEGGHLLACHALLEHGASVNLAKLDGGTALDFAAMHGYKELCTLLLNHGADVNQCTNVGWSPLMFASQKGRRSIIELLVSRGADVNLCSTKRWERYGAGATALSVAEFDFIEDEVVAAAEKHGQRIKRHVPTTALCIGLVSLLAIILSWIVLMFQGRVAIPL